ncbi:MAG: hypothetical protein ACI9MC_001958, partial [Kiritimatiellia bacterium]
MPHPLQHVMSQYDNQTDLPKLLLELLAVNEGGGMRAWSLRALVGSITQTQLPITRVQSALRPLIESGAVEEGVNYYVQRALGEGIVRKLIRNGTYDERAEMVASESPLDTISHYIQPGPTLREARRAWLKGDDQSALTILNRYETWKGRAPSTTWLLHPIPTQRLRDTDPDLATLLLEEAQLRAHTYGLALPDLRDVLLHMVDTYPDHQPLAVMWARELVLQGELSRAIDLLDGDASIEANALVGAIELAVGRCGPSAKTYAKALSALRKLHGNKQCFINDVFGPFQPLAYLYSSTKSRTPQAHRLVRETLKTPLRESPLWMGYHRLNRMFTYDRDDMLVTAPRAGTHPIAALFEGLCARWLDEEVDEQALNAAHALAELNGWGWIAAEIDVVRTADTSKALPDTVPLLTHRTPVPRWVSRLE